MRNLTLHIIQLLDQRLAPFSGVSHISRPDRGWLREIRTTLKMTMAQVSERIGISKQSYSQLEKRELSEGITLGSLREAGAAMGLKLVYGFVPKEGTLEAKVEERLYALAERIVDRAHTHMVLEDQASYGDRNSRAVEELVAELKRDLTKRIWD